MIRGFGRLLRRATADAGDGVSDAALLARFAADRDPAAFELLVWRHAAMVLGVCRRVLRDEHLAEDAFQATFLVLARKAGSVRGSNLAGWLFRVARRVAVRAKRPARERVLTVEPAGEVREHPSEAAEQLALLDEEIARLPERLRRPVLLCYLGGRSTEDAAAVLGCPRGTVLSRLATARERLAARLTRRGVTLPATAGISFSVVSPLVSKTIHLAAAVRAGVGTGGTPAALAEGVVRAMTLTKLAGTAGVLLVAGGLCLGVGWGQAQPGQAQPGQAATGQPPAAAAQDRPAGRAVAGTKDDKERLVRLRAQRAKLAEQVDRVRMNLARLNEAAGTEVDHAVLRAELAKIDRAILSTEADARRFKQNLELARREEQEAAKKQPNPVDVNNTATALLATTEAKRAHDTASRVVKQVEQVTAPDSPIAVAAKKELAATGERLEAAREAARTEAEKKVRQSYTAHAAAVVESNLGSVNNATMELAQLTEDRRRLVGRIQAAQAAESNRQAAADELSVLRELLLDVMRQQLIADLGLEGVPGTRPPPDRGPGSDNRVDELRREVEALRDEVERLKKKP